MSTKWYLAGPMSNIPQFNFPLFDKVAAALRAQGADIISPAEMDEPEVRAAAMASPDGRPDERTSGGKTWGDFLARDLKLIADQCDGVVLMPGWRGSTGARQELFTALNCRKRVAELVVGSCDTYAIEERSAAYFCHYLSEKMKEICK